MTDSQIMMIVPTENGFIFMPFDLNVLVSVDPKKTACVKVAQDISELGELVIEHYVNIINAERAENVDA